MVTSPLAISVFIYFLLSSPCKDSYIIQIPTNIDIVEEGTFNVNIIDNDLDPYQTLHIEFDEQFTLSDSHGKQDISGYTTGSSLSIQANDTQSRTVGYHLPEIPVGSWNGSLGVSIWTETVYPSNLLISGSQLNQIIAAYGPTCVEFSNSVVNTYDNVFDVSLAQDGSVMLYEIDSENRIIISNSIDRKIKANSDMSDLFKNIMTITEIRNIDLLDLSECLSISGMFSGANHLATISGLSDLETGNVRDMSCLFASTNRLRSMDLSDWDVSNVRNMSGMFNSSYISDFSSIEQWDTSAVEDMSDMFSQSKQVTSLDLSNWNVSDVKDMSNMFYTSRNLVSIDLSSWDTSKCRNMSGMFEGSQKLSNIIGLSLLDTGNVEDMSGMFSATVGLTSLNLGGWDTENVKDMSYMFNATNITDLGDISSWDVNKVESFEGMFRNCQNLNSLSDLGLWNVSDSCNNISLMFYNTGSILPDNLDLSGWDTENVVTTSYMFYGCRSLEYLDISGWNTSNLIDASGMFEYSTVTNESLLKNVIGIENLNISSLKNISRMFMLNRFLNVDISSWNTEGLENISYAFSGCYRQDLDKLKHWNVSSVTDMNNCFADGAGSISGTSAPSWYIN